MRCHNFSAGPAGLPTVVLEKAREEFLEWQDCGSSVMEVSHRGSAFVEMAHSVESNLRTLLQIDDDYAVLFMHGGATAQFAAVPLNLLGNNECADYIDSGHWAKRAIKEAEHYCTPQIVSHAIEDDGLYRMPAISEWRCNNRAAYFHYTPNETIHGLEFHAIPEVQVPLVADCSSNILSRPMDIKRFGLVYAGAQKNIGPAGMAVVIVRKDLLDRAAKNTPIVMHYAQALKHESMCNTPPAFVWYMTGLVFEWLLDLGGVEEMERRNERKARTLYNLIDKEPFYNNMVATEYRSRMNIPFVLARPELDQEFLNEAEVAGLRGLKGHRAVGGMRASLYNAIEQKSVDTLAAFMLDFAKRRG